jgi:hypothetical protein
MFCEKCQIDPTFHSFTNIGTYNGVKYFYTAPLRSKDYTKDGSKLENFKKHALETDNQPWEWIVDCGDIGSNEPVDIKYITGVIKFLSEIHENTLRKVYVIKLNSVVKAAVFVIKKLFKQNLFDRIEYLDGSPLELYLQYEKAKFPSKMIKWLNSIDHKKGLPATPVF